MKYKLINEYPGSPKKGTIITSPLYRWDHNGRVRRIEKSFFEDPNSFPAIEEFWEEVEESLFEIIDIRATEEFIRKNPDCFSKWTPEDIEDIDLDCMLNSGYSVIDGSYYIHSVKRVSDGQVFSVGDKVVWDWVYCGSNSYLTLEKITIDKEFEFKEISEAITSQLRHKNDNLNFRIFTDNYVTVKEAVDAVFAHPCYNKTSLTNALNKISCQR